MTFKQQLKEVLEKYRDSGKAPVQGVYTTTFNGEEYTNVSYGELDVFINWLDED